MRVTPISLADIYSVIKSMVKPPFVSKTVIRTIKFLEENKRGKLLDTGLDSDWISHQKVTKTKINGTKILA